MDPVALLSSMFPDQGRALLGDAGLDGWPQALRGLPPAAIDVRRFDPDVAGEVLLSRCRDAHVGRGELRPALAFTRALLRRRVGRLGDRHPDTLAELGALGALLDQAGHTDEGGPMLERARLGLEAAGARDLRLAVVAGNLGLHYLRTGRDTDAERALELALRLRREQAPQTSGQVAAQLGELKLRLEKTDAAVPLLQEAFSRYRDAYGPQDPRTVARARTLATVLVALGRGGEALPVLRVIHAAPQADPDQRARTAFQLAMALEDAGEREEAWRVAVQALAITRAAGDPHPELATRLTALARMARARGHLHDADGWLLEAYEAERRLHGDDSWQAAVASANLGHHCAQLGRTAEALGWLESGALVLRGTLGREHPHTIVAVEMLVDLWRGEAEKAFARRDARSARPLLDRARELAIDVLGREHPSTRAIERLRH